MRCLEGRVFDMERPPVPPQAPRARAQLRAQPQAQLRAQPQVRQRKQRIPLGQALQDQRPTGIPPRLGTA
jgi:hypothetical protein